MAAGVMVAGKTTVRSVAVLMALLVATLAGLELAARVGIVRVSNTERRFARDYQAALSAGHDPSRPSVLLVGNSLLLEDVLPDRLQASLGGDADARIVPVVETMYFDWFYGLRNLFGRGSQPDVVGLVLGRWHLTSDFFRGPYSAHRLLGVRDIFSLSRDLDLHPTMLSSYLAAHMSAFYGLRTEVRAAFLQRLVPGVDQLAPVFGGSAPFVESRRETETVDVFPIALERLVRLRELARSHGARFVLILPPIGPERRRHGDDTVLRAAAQAGVTVIETDAADWYPESAFRDGLHMNEAGAMRYTVELADALRRIVDERSQ